MINQIVPGNTRTTHLTVLEQLARERSTQLPLTHRYGQCANMWSILRRTGRAVTDIAVILIAKLRRPSSGNSSSRKRGTPAHAEEEGRGRRIATVQARPDAAIRGRRQGTEEEGTAGATGLSLLRETGMTGGAGGTEIGRRMAGESPAEKEIEVSGRLGQREQT